jgi:MFS family permease
LTLGIKTDLDLTGDKANTALVVFYAPYILFEIPSNILLKRLNPHVWLSGCIVAFGVVMLGQAFVKSYGGLIATRFFLGLAEAGVFPGSFYLISFWYKREESQKRFTVYWSSVILAGAFGGLLATAISKMDGMRGLASWQWIFLLEGIAAILVGIAAFFFTCDFPKEASWLTPEEKAFVIAKTKSDESHTVSITKQDYVDYFLDPKAWLGAVMYFCE